MKCRKPVLTTFLFVITAFCSFSQDISWYKCLSGAIDKYPVTMHLHKMGHAYSGYYYYDKTQQPIYFDGSDTITKGMIELTAYEPGNNNETEQFLFNTGSVSIGGSWQRSDGKTLDFFANEIKDSSLLSFIYVYTYGQTKLRPAMKESPIATYEAASVWTTGNSPTDDFIRKIVRKIFNADSLEDIGAYFIGNKKKMFKEYKDDYKDESETDLKERSYSFSMDVITNLMINYQSNKILSFANYTYEYTGGAHGNGGTSYTVLDLVHHKELSIDDIIKANSKMKLRKLLENYFRKNYALKETDSLQEADLFENKIEPNDNFYITGKGICFSYTPYEIGPYSMGQIEIFIPFTELNNYLQPAFKELIE